MDIEKLIEQLKKSADFEDYPVVASFAAIIEKKYLREASTALSTLQAENAQLRAYLEYEREHANAYYEECGQWEVENEKLRDASVMVNQCMTMREEVAERFSLTANIPLERLRELVELYSNVPHICDYCIGCEIEPTDGHGCDGYDNFVFSVRRIVAALKAREQE